MYTKALLLILISFGCTHSQQADDLIEISEFPTEALDNKPEHSTENKHSNDDDQRPVTIQMIRSLHVTLHKYAKSFNYDSKVKLSNLGFQHEEIIQTLAGFETSDRSNLVKSVLLLSVFEKAVESFLNSNNQFHVQKETESLEAPIELFEGNNEPTETLDSLARDFELDIPIILKENRLLAFPYIHNFILISLENMKVSEALSQEVRQAVLDVSTPWFAIYKKLVPENFTREEDSGISGEIETPTDEVESIKPPISYFPGEFAEGEDTLNDAKKLANKHLYSEAISKLKSIDEDSPYSTAKLEMIKKYSNQAVKQLRRKAAQSFQSAIPTPDLEAKLDYLKAAETYLRDAIEDFPDADQLEKVRANLSMIQKRIKILENQRNESL